MKRENLKLILNYVLLYFVAIRFFVLSFVAYKFIYLKWFATEPLWSNQIVLGITILIICLYIFLARKGINQRGNVGTYFLLGIIFLILVLTHFTNVAIGNLFNDDPIMAKIEIMLESNYDLCKVVIRVAILLLLSFMLNNELKRRRVTNEVEINN